MLLTANRMMFVVRCWALPVLSLIAQLPAQAQDLRVAVAANFAPAGQELATDFEARSGHRVRLSSGATGMQITQGTPFDVLLAADAVWPQRLIVQDAVLLRRGGDNSAAHEFPGFLRVVDGCKNVGLPWGWTLEKNVMYGLDPEVS